MNDSVHKVGHGNHHAQKHTFGKAKHSGGMPKVIPKTQDAVKTATDRAIIRYVGGKVPGDSGPVKRAAADIWKRYQLLKHGGAQCFASAIGSSDAVIPEGCQDILRAATEIAAFEDALDQLQQHLDETFPGKGYGRYIQHIKTALIAEASHLKSSTINFVRLAVAVSFQESSFNPKLVSGQNAMGVMQLQGPTAIMVLAMMPPSAWDALDIQPNSELRKNLMNYNHLLTLSTHDMEDDATMQKLQTMINESKLPSGHELLTIFAQMQAQEQILSNRKLPMATRKAAETAYKTLAHKFYPKFKQTLVDQGVAALDKNQIMFNPAMNIAMGVYYLANLIGKYSPTFKKTDDLLKVVLAAYNQGSPSIDEYLNREPTKQHPYGGKTINTTWMTGLSRKTQQYIYDIIANYKGKQVSSLHLIPNTP